MFCFQVQWLDLGLDPFFEDGVLGELLTLNPFYIPPIPRSDESEELYVLTLIYAPD